MAKPKLMYQCRFETDDGWQTVGYIEERGAKLGAYVELPELAEGPVWRVTAVDNHPIDITKLRDKQNRDKDFGPSLVDA